MKPKPYPIPLAILLGLAFGILIGWLAGTQHYAENVTVTVTRTNYVERAVYVDAPDKPFIRLRSPKDQ